MSNEATLTLDIAAVQPLVEKEFTRISTFVTANKKKYVELYAKMMDERLKKSWYMRIFHRSKLKSIQHTFEQALQEINILGDARQPYLTDESGEDVCYYRSAGYLKDLEEMKEILTNAKKHNLNGTITLPITGHLYAMLAYNLKS